uniref:Uncharacterized protein n=1 Tax=Haptolina brevifila TaxID=156173 RepID=A0A7S2CF46_9EUKA
MADSADPLTVFRLPLPARSTAWLHLSYEAWAPFRIGEWAVARATEASSRTGSSCCDILLPLPSASLVRAHVDALLRSLLLHNLDHTLRVALVSNPAGLEATLEVLATQLRAVRSLRTVDLEVHARAVREIPDVMWAALRAAELLPPSWTRVIVLEPAALVLEDLAELWSLISPISPAAPVSPAPPPSAAHSLSQPSCSARSDSSHPPSLGHEVSSASDGSSSAGSSCSATHSRPFLYSSPYTSISSSSSVGVMLINLSAVRQLWPSTSHSSQVLSSKPARQPAGTLHRGRHPALRWGHGRSAAVLAEGWAVPSETDEASLTGEADGASLPGKYELWRPLSCVYGYSPLGLPSYHQLTTDAMGVPYVLCHSQLAHQAFLPLHRRRLLEAYGPASRVACECGARVRILTQVDATSEGTYMYTKLWATAVGSWSRACDPCHEESMAMMCM